MPDGKQLDPNVDWKLMSERLRGIAKDMGVPVTKSGGTTFSGKTRPFKKLSLSERHAADAGVSYDPRCAPPKEIEP